jgi:translation initiation factor IF-3
MAEEAGLDLVEVAPEARPIVVRIMDWGKHRFEAEKKVREARKKESRITVKQIKLRPNIGEHDLETKLTHARRFLVDGDKVKVTIMFRGRDLRRPENGRKVLDKVIQILNDAALVESFPGDIINRDMSMILGPRKH